jgi:16S rRNA (uracil1498-N3)-methyltransferase
VLRHPNAPIRHPSPLVEQESILLDREAVEALRFRQVNVKEAFTIQDSTGAFFRASLRVAGEREGSALVYERMARSPEPVIDLCLYCAVLSRQRMILVAQKATELGVNRLQPVFSGYSVKPEGLEHEKAHAWPGQAVRAAKQCRRASVPEVADTVPLEQALQDETWRDADARYYLDDRAPESAPYLRGATAVCLAAGPEGGWTDRERELLQASGALPLVLGGRVLRAETAVLAGLVLVQYELGDLRT